MDYFSTGFDFFNGTIQWWQVLIVVADYTLKFIALGWVPQERRPSSAMAWLLAMFLIPFVGFFLFFLMGSPVINRRRHKIQNQANELIHTIGAQEPDYPGQDESPRRGQLLGEQEPTTSQPQPTGEQEPAATHVSGKRVQPTRIQEEIASMITLNRTLTGMPAVSGDIQNLYSDYEESIAAMARSIDQAHSYVHVEIYIMAWDKSTDIFFQALRRAVERGVTVRLLFDHVGSWKYPGYRTLGKRLDAIGVEWMVMLPLQPWRWRFRRPDLRNHRKILIIDGHTAFIGSQNMIDSSYLMKKNQQKGRHWVDVMAEVSGSIVTMIDSVFAVDWFTESQEELQVRTPEMASLYAQSILGQGQEGNDILQLLPSGPGFTTEPNLRFFTSMVHHAKTRLRLVSPYFIPDESLLEAVTTAAYRGVQVELYVSEESDQFIVGHAQSSYYKELLTAGVEIYLYPSPAILHAKFAVADEDLCWMGSSNMDMRSFGLNYEVIMVSAYGSLLQRLHCLADEYQEKSRLLTAEEWAERPWYHRYLDSVCRLTSSLQ